MLNTQELTLEIYKAHKCSSKQSHELTPNIECKNHVISIIMEIDNEAHMKFLYKHELHKNLIYIKTKKTLRRMLFCLN